MKRKDPTPSLQGAGRAIERDVPTIPPYGGFRVELPVSVVDGILDERLQSGLIRELDGFEFAHLRMFALGAYQPLAGFMGAADVRSVLQHGCLTDFLPWEVPVYLPAETKFESGSRLILTYEGDAYAELKVTSCEQAPDELPASRRSGGRSILGGELTLFVYQDTQLSDRQQEWNALIEQLKHRNHPCLRAAVVGLEAWRTDDEYLIASAIETNDQVLLHVENRPETVDHSRLSKSIVQEVTDFVLDNYHSGDHLVVSPVAVELFDHDASLMHLAIVYQNLGCRRLMVVSETEIQLAPELSAMDIDIVALPPAFHCTDCDGHSTRKLCTHPGSARSRLPESDMLKMLMLGEQLPSSVVRPEVARLLSRQLSAPGTLTQQALNRRHIFPHASKLTINSRIQLNGHRSAVLWMTGLSGSGKSTLATHLEKELVFTGHQVCVLDGDTLRNGLCSDLNFSPEGRRENLRRAAETAKILAQNGMLVLASFISPFSEEREMLRDIIGNHFFEVYIEASLEDCEKRDPKGLYQRARAGVIPEFTGVTSPYEVPANPDLRVNTSKQTVEEAVRQLMFEMQSIGLLKRTGTEFRTDTSVPAPNVFNSARRI